MAARVVWQHRRASRVVRLPETGGPSRRRRAGWCAKEHGGATTELSVSSHEEHSPAFAGRAARSRRGRLFGDGTRNRRCPGTRTSALGHDGCGVRAQGWSGAHVRRAPSSTAQWHRRHRDRERRVAIEDRKSTRLNSSHLVISYAVFCLKKKTKRDIVPRLEQGTLDYDPHI